MIISFCGHANFRGSEEYEERIISFLEKTLADSCAVFYLGGYGEFDEFAYSCCVKFKKTHPNTMLVFVTPYISIEYQKNHLIYLKERYDSILYPELEDKPLKYAIYYRNRYMVDKADYIIAYVSHDWGGAFKTYRYAMRKGKKIFNLADFDV